MTKRTSKGSDRRRDGELRVTVDEYRRLASEAKRAAANAVNKAKRENFLALAEKWTELADTLQGRDSG